MSAHPTPPKLAYWLLSFFCRADYRDEVVGDLQEVYEWRLSKNKVILAKYRYFLDALSAIRFYQGGRFMGVITNAMLFSFVKSSFRNFNRNLGYTCLNVLGLTLGISASLFILEYASEELNYNNSSASDHLYRVSNDYYRFGKMVYESSMTFSGVGPAMVRDLPEVTESARLYSASISRGGSEMLSRPDKPEMHFKEQELFFADPAYLDFFDLTIDHGTNELGKPNTVLLTAKLAEKYFGSGAQAIGKMLLYTDGLSKHELTVVGVFNKPAFSLQVDPEALISYGTLEQHNPESFVNDWGGNSFMTFIKLTKNTDPKVIEQAMSDLTLRYKPGYAEKDEDGAYLRINRYFLTGVRDIHLHSKFQNEVGPIGDATTIKILQAIALFIVIIAWINFINLSTAKSVDRAREVGIRKSLGAQRRELVVQFFIEALLVNGMALLIALVFVVGSQPLFNLFVDKNLSLESIDLNVFGWPSVIIFLVGTSLSGFYPAIVLSSHQVINSLKGKSKVDAGLFLRRGLIVFQLLFSSLLIIATLAINQQLLYMHSQDMGFDMEQVLILSGPVINSATGEENVSNIQRFKQEVLAISGVKSMGTSTIIPGQGILRGNAMTRTKEDDLNMHSIERVVASNDFLSTIKVDFIAGEDFSSEMKGFVPVILNASAARQLEFADPKDAVGQLLYESTRFERKIVGVIEDYHHESLNRPIDPMYFVRNDAYDVFYAIRLSTNEINRTIAHIEEKYKEAYPGNPVDYYFLDQFFGEQYKRDYINRKVFSAFAVMAIIVACLGLYGLSSFSALQRTKEVGVRKVLGATVSGLFILLSKEVMILMLIGFVTAVPVAWLGIESWLTGFAYRMPIGPLLFFIPLLLIAFITIIATASKILKVALANPVESLRYE